MRANLLLVCVSLSLLMIALRFDARAECCRIEAHEWTTSNPGAGYVGWAKLPVDSIPRECSFLWLIANCPFTTYDYECVDDCSECAWIYHHRGDLMLVAETEPYVCSFSSVFMGGPWGPEPLACATIQDQILYNFGSAIYVECTSPED